MILDDGICTVFRATDVAKQGNMPVYSHTAYDQGWYKTLNFSSAPKYATAYAEDTIISNKIRVLQNRAIGVHDRVALADVDSADGQSLYDIIRIYHGSDEDGIPITDLELEAVET